MNEPGWLEVERQWLEVGKTIDAVIANLRRFPERAALPLPSIKPIDGLPPPRDFADEVVILVRILATALLDAMKARRIATALGRVPEGGIPDAPQPG